MTTRNKIRATLTSHHYPGDPEDAPDRLFRIEPQKPTNHSRPWTAISDIHAPDDRHHLVEQVAKYRRRAGAPDDSGIEILIPLSFFQEEDRRKAYNQVWVALLDAQDQLADL